jgi:tRNA-2-methylthio-N6-dimethylallyladenosine synthase
MAKLIELPMVGAVSLSDIHTTYEQLKREGKKGVFIQTLGCQMNEHDTEKMLGLLKTLDYEPVQSLLAADLILYNTCAVRENPERKLYGQINTLKQLKEARPELLIGICGCMTQQTTALQKMQEELSHVDLIFGTHNIHRLPELIHRVEAGERVIEVWSQEGPMVEGLPVERASAIKAYVTIMYGCNQFCTYCIVPYVRGKERSRELEDIVTEVEALTAAGYKEIMLLGQNVNSYGQDLAGDVTFAKLLYALDAIPGIGRIRYTSPHPRYFSCDVIEAMAECNSVCEHVHMPIQAGNDRILRRMGRRYTRAQYIELVTQMRQAIPDLAITTDFIVGFPGETEDEFQDTLSIVSEVGFDNSFMFIFSPRTGTPAAKLAEQIDEDTKRDRIHRLIEAQNHICLQRNEACVGKEFEVLVDGLGKEPGFVAGRTRTGKLVTFSAAADLVGQLVQVRITKANTWSLEGVLC